MGLTRLSIRKLKTSLYFISAWIFVSEFYVFLRFWPFSPQDTYGLGLFELGMIALQFGLLMGLTNGVYESFIVQDQRKRHTALEASLTKIIFYSTALLVNLNLVAMVDLSSFHDRDMLSPETRDAVVELMLHPEFLALTVFTIFSSFIISFFRYVTKKFGLRSMLNALLGKYQHPIEEERIFMFIDLKSATVMAETMGTIKYSSFLREYFHYISNICVENNGEVYQFAGDGVILTWKLSQNRSKPRCINCVFDIQDCLIKTRYRFVEEFGVYPEFKVALHAGMVIATEVGGYGSEMAFHGDTLNTTARLQSLCNLLKKDFLITQYLLNKLPDLEDVLIESQGNFQLKGKSRDIEVFSIRADTGLEPAPKGAE
jgi:adenylate cyclase